MAPDSTNVNFIGLAFTLFMGVLSISLPRRVAFVPVFLTLCYITLGQVINVGGLHFTMMRVLLLFGWIGLLARHELNSVKLNAIDKVFVLWVASGFAVYIFRELTWEAVQNRLGFAYNAFGGYFLFRFLLRDFNEVNRALKIIAIVIVPLALGMVLERATGRNLFAIFGGVSSLTAIRDGQFRCQGSFADPILAGTFGATLVPLFVSPWFNGMTGRLVTATGIAAASVITVLSHSSGPGMAYLFGIVGLAAWPFRARMGTVRWTLLIGVVSLHLIMKAPVYALIGRLSELIGGTGYHRVEVIDAAVKHFGEWWLSGTGYTAHWGPLVLPSHPESIDITNQYIFEGVNGGLVTMLLFIAVIAFAFHGVGKSLKANEIAPLGVRLHIWALGAALFAHAMSFLSIAYFDQLVLAWYFLLALIATATESYSDWATPTGTGDTECESGQPVT